MSHDRSPIDLSGQIFERLTVIRRVKHATSPKAHWLCRCICGTTIIARASRLKTGATKSCGCYQREAVGKRFSTHGGTKIPGYTSWNKMLYRCYKPTSKDFADYGGRGITVCEEWRTSFMQFLADMGPRPTPQHTVDRKDNEGPYSKENCYWATRLEQMNNTRKNHFLSFDGKSQTIAQWARELGISSGVIDARLRRSHWSVERTLTTPVHRQHAVLHR